MTKLMQNKREEEKKMERVVDMPNDKCQKG